MAHTALAVAGLCLALCTLPACTGDEGGCVIRVCYYAADGTPALSGEREAWFFAWERDPDAGRFFHLTLDARDLAVFRGPYGQDCVRFASYVRPQSCDTITLWAKIQGFAITATKASCGSEVKQVVEPVAAETEAEQLCERPIVDTACRITGAIQDQAGAPIAADVVWLLAQRGDGGVFEEGYWQQGSLPGGQFIVDGVQPAVFGAPARQPRLQCLNCGENTVVLEPLDPACDRGCSAGGAAAGRGVHAPLWLAFVAASWTIWTIRRRRRTVLDR